ncbi:hypothetical protein MRX96_015483 [Rhipicephalus microplus]
MIFLSSVTLLVILCVFASRDWEGVRGGDSVSLIRATGDLLIQATFFSAIPRCSVDLYQGFKPTLEFELAQAVRAGPGLGTGPGHGGGVLCVVFPMAVTIDFAAHGSWLRSGAAMAAVSAATVVAAAVRRL